MGGAATSQNNYEIVMPLITRLIKTIVKFMILTDHCYTIVLM